MTQLSPNSSDRILDVFNIEVVYNSVALVLKGVSLSVPKGGVVALLGANGAGKTTTLKAISNLLRAERGEVTKGAIMFEGERVDRLSPNDLVRRGAIQVMEGRRCFGHLTIEENLLTGAFTRRDGRAAAMRDLERVYAYFPRIKERRSAQAGYASGGEQQMCAIGRAMMSRPKLILLDEPSMGLAPQVVEEIFAIVRFPQRERGRPRFCLPSRTPISRCKSLVSVTSWRPGALCSTVPRRRCAQTKTCANSISASPGRIGARSRP